MIIRICHTHSAKLKASPNPACKHMLDTLGYIAWHNDAERRGKQGQKQRKCPECNLYIWNYLYRAWAKAVERAMEGEG